jgi:hypothetical protein
MATRQIVVLDGTQDPTGVNLNITMVCWLVAPATRILPLPSFVSRVPQVSSAIPWGISTAELTALQAGTLVEQTTVVSLIVANLTVPMIEAACQARYVSLQQTLTNLVFANAVHFVGAFFDGTTWTGGP